MELSRSFNDILQISWPFLRKIVSELKKTVLRRSREEDLIEGSDYETGYFDERKPSNVDDINVYLLNCT